LPPLSVCGANTVRRVVVTGIGALSPLGNTFARSWESLKAGLTGLGPISSFDASGLPWRSAGELKGYRPGDHLSRKEILRLDPFVHYAVSAADMAAADAGLQSKALSSAAVIVGSSRGGVRTLELRNTSAFVMPASTVSMAASYTARHLGARGHVLGVSNACASGANAVGEAMRLIKHGHADVALAGGAEAPVCALCVRGYGAAGALSRSGVSRPFDARRDGFVIAEGASVLVLEEYGRAEARGARIYGEVAGYGNTADAFHLTVPDLEGQAKAMEAALAEAGLGPADIGYVNAHATSTPVGDTIEAGAIRRVFGGEVPVSSVKSMTGHMLGASAAFEAAVTLMALFEGTIPPATNLEEPEGGLNYVTQAQKAALKAAVSNSFGFGGVNAVLVFRRI